MHFRAFYCARVCSLLAIPAPARPRPYGNNSARNNSTITGSANKNVAGRFPSERSRLLLIAVFQTGRILYIVADQPPPADQQYRILWQAEQTLQSLVVDRIYKSRLSRIYRLAFMRIICHAYSKIRLLRHTNHCISYVIPNTAYIRISLKTRELKNVYYISIK